jgi:predicted permease
MKLLRKWLRPRRDFEQNMNEELRDHLERQTDANIAAGMTSAEARREALLQLGALEGVKDGCREERRGFWLEALWADCGYSARTLRKNPSFAAVTILTLALGIGANTAIFSVVNAVLLRPLAYKDPQQLVVILQSEHNPIAPANFLDWRAQNHVFERMGAAEAWSPDLTGHGTPEHLEALHLSSDVLPLLGVQPELGRTFSADEEHLGHAHVVVLSHNLWKNHFAGNDNIVGQSVALDGESYAIIGVMPAGFKFAPFWATKAELWAPLVLDARQSDRTGASLRIFARLRRGVTLQQARTEMAAITARLAQKYPGTNHNITVTRLQEKVVGAIRPALLMLQSAVILVLLIACANVAHLQLVRATVRMKEMAVRTALGASRNRLIRQLLTESAALALAGAFFGFLLAYAGVRLLLAFAPPNIPRVDTISMDSPVFAFMLAVTAGAGLIFSLAPALKSSRIDVIDSLKEGGRTPLESSERNHFRNFIVASEFALALVLLVGAGLIVRSFFGLLSVNPGFDPRNVVSAVVSVTGSKEADPHLRAPFFQELTARIGALPGVESASMINHLPLHGDVWGFPFAIEGRPPARPGESPVGAFRVVLPGYFHAMRIPILQGRDFTGADVLSAQHVVIINDFMAHHHWPGEDPLGQRITTDDPKNPDWSTIVGVVADSKQSDWAGATWEEMYFPFLQSRPNLEGPNSSVAYMTLVVRTTSDPERIVPSIRQTVWSIDKNLPVSDVITMDQAIAEQVAEPRFYVLMLSIFSCIALLLGAVGIYGVISYSMARRTHEIGVRMALGAERAHIFRMVVKQGMRMAALGSAAGILGSLGLMQLLRSLLFGVQPTDPLTFAIATVILGFVALAACYVPARRAMRLDPMTALRYE